MAAPDRFKLRRQSTAKLLKIQKEHTCSCDACGQQQERLVHQLSALRSHAGLPLRDAPKEPHVPATEHTCSCDACDETLAKLEARVEAMKEAAGALASLGIRLHSSAPPAEEHSCGCAACAETLVKLVADAAALESWKDGPGAKLAAAIPPASLLVGLAVGGVAAAGLLRYLKAARA